MVIFNSTDLDNATSESGVVHESVANTDHNDASNLKQGYSIESPYLSQNLVGYWPLQEDSGTTAYDFSGNANDGTTNGGVTVNQTGILGTSAYSFDGMDDYVDVGNPLGDTTTTNFAISMWVNPASLSAEDALFGESDSGDNGQTILWTSDSITGDIFFKLRDENRDSISVRTDNAVLSTNTWHFVSAVKTGNTASDLTIYVDGAEPPQSIVSDQTFNGATPNVSQFIGAWNAAGSPNRGFDGKICNVYIHNAALTAAQVQTIYDVVATSGTLTTQYKTV